MCSPHSLHLPEGFRQGVHHPGQGAELVEQGVGQAVYVPLGNGVAQQKLQELVVVEILAVGQKLGLEPLAVAVVEPHASSLPSLPPGPQRAPYSAR